MVDSKSTHSSYRPGHPCALDRAVSIAAMPPRRALKGLSPASLRTERAGTGCAASPHRCTRLPAIEETTKLSGGASYLRRCQNPKPTRRWSLAKEAG